MLVSSVEAAGPLRVNPANPRYFVDASGRPVYLTGAHVNNSLVDRSDKVQLDFTSYLDFLQYYQHNFIRLWAWEQAAWTYESAAKIEFGPLPYQRTGPATALDGKPKFDLSQFNQAYFDRLRARVIAAGQRGIYVSVMLFQGFSSQPKTGTGNPWPGHPFNSSNNINGINGDANGNGSGEEVHSLSAASITALQKVYVQKVVDTLNDLDNVLYEISGEAPLASKDWQYHMIDYLKAYQAIKAKQHPVGISYFYDGTGPELFASHADWILFPGTDDNPPLAGGDKVLLSDPSPAILSSATAYQWVWKSFMRGFNPVFQLSDLANSSIDERALNSMAWTLNITQSADISSMSPSDTVCSTGYCLVNPGLEYLAYAQTGGVKVDLSGAKGDFIVTWFVPATGQTISGGTISGGKRVQLAAPVAGDVVLHLLSAAEASLQAATNSLSANNPFAFTLSNPGSFSVAQGSSTAANISLTFGAKKSTVNFSVSGIPQGTTASLSKSSCNINCSTVLTLNATAAAALGTYTITVTGTNSKGSSSTSFALTVTAPATTTTVQPPTLSPNGGTYASAVSVSMATATSGASIFYTTDGSSPTTSAKLYTGAFTLTTSTIVKGKAFKNTSSSSETSAWFTTNAVSPFDFSLSNSGNKSVTAGSSVTNSISASLTSGSTQPVSFSASGLPSGATASFSSTSCSPSCSTVLTIATSGATPASNYSITVTSTGGGVTRTSAFTLSVGAAVASTVATPTITPNGGSFTNFASVTMATATSGASIYYTTNGTSPTQSSTLYSGAMTLTSSATVKAKAFKSGYNASAEASASLSISSVIGAANLVGYWKFDEGTGTTAADSSANGNNGTLVNGPMWSGGIAGNALYFDGTDDNVTVMDSNSLDLSNAFTLSAWVNPATTFTDFRSILVKNYKYYLYASVAGYCGDGSPLGGFSEITNNTVCQPAPLPINTWTHLSVASDGSTLTLYRNGVAVATASVVETLSPSTGTLQVGGSQYGEYFQGLIDEVRVYNRALTNSEIQTIYQQAAVNLPVDYSLSNSGDRSVNAGSSATNSINATLISGGSQAVSFSVSGLPSGATGSFSSASCALNCSTVLTISTSGSTPAGNYPITVTSAGGGVKRSTIFTLSVTFALTVATPTITPNGGTFSSSVSVSMQSTTAGSSTYYTTDGSAPTQSSTLYTGAMTLTSSATVKAAAFKSGYNPSAVASAAFTNSVTNTTGTVYYAATNGSDSNPGTITQPFRTIRKGLGILRASETLYIRGGTYGEIIDSNTQTLPTGTSWANAPVISGYPGETVIINGAAGSGAVINIAASYIQYLIFKDFILDASGSTFCLGTYGTPHHVRFQNIEAKNAAMSCFLQNAGSTFFEFINNRVHNNGRNASLDHGFYLNGADNLIEGNDIYSNTAHGIQIYPNPQRNIIRRNKIHGNGTLGSTTYGIVAYGDNNKIYNNLVYDMPSGTGGIYLGGGSSTAISNNTIYNSGGTGIQVSAGASGITIRNNIIRGHSTDVGDVGSATLKGNNLCQNLSAGCVSIANPAFMNAASSNFALQAGSPAINAGETVSEVTDDFAGVQRPSGAAFDIGAYEYSGN